MNFLNRVLTAAGLVALAVMLSVWLSRSPLTAPAPLAAVKPIVAPSPTPITLAAAPVLSEMPAEGECDGSAVAAKPAEPKPGPRCCYAARRRGLLGRRR